MASTSSRELKNQIPEKSENELLVELLTTGKVCDVDYLEAHLAAEADEAELSEESSDHLPVILEKSFEEIGKGMEAIHPHVKKKIIKTGIYGLIPPDATVTIHYESYFENKTEPFDSTLDRKKPYRVRADNEDLFEGMSIALQSMKLDESAHFLMNWQVVYGEHGCLDVVPPKANLFVVIHVVKVTREETSTSHNFDVIMEEAQKLLIFGKRQFVSNCRGMNHLRAALELLDKCKITENEDEQQRQLEDMKLRILSNLCGMNNRINRPELAIVQAREALLIDPRCEKALLAMAEGHKRLRNFSTAREYFSKGMAFYPDVLAFRDGLENLKNRQGAN